MEGTEHIRIYERTMAYEGPKHIKINERNFTYYCCLGPWRPVCRRMTNCTLPAHDRESKGCQLRRTSGAGQGSSSVFSFQRFTYQDQWKDQLKDIGVSGSMEWPQHIRINGRTN